MPCVYQSFTSPSGEYPEILLQSQLEGSLGRAGHVNTKQLTSRVPPTSHTRTILKYLKVADLQKAWTEEISGCYLLCSPVQDQLVCSQTRIWFNLVLKVFLWWGSRPHSSNLFHCFIPRNKEKFSWNLTEISLLQFQPSISCPMSSFDKL